MEPKNDKINKDGKKVIYNTLRMPIGEINYPEQKQIDNINTINIVEEIIKQKKQEQKVPPKIIENKNDINNKKKEIENPKYNVNAKGTDNIKNENLKPNKEKKENINSKKEINDNNNNNNKNGINQLEKNDNKALNTRANNLPLCPVQFETSTKGRLPSNLIDISYEVNK